MGSVPSEVSKYMGNAVKLSDIWGSIIYNVKAYGAKGDGVTDDTVSINKAISACSSAGGGIVFFPPGTYIKDGGVTITIPSNVHVIGSGVGSTIIKLKNSASNRTVFLIANFANNASISDLSIDGNRANQTANDGYGIFSYKSNDCKIERVNITKCCFQGIGLSNCFNFTIRDCYSNYNYNFGYWIYADLGQVEPYASGNHTIENCDGHYNDLDGLLVDSHGCTIINSRFNYNGQQVHSGGALGAAGIYSDRRVNKLKLINNNCSFNKEFGINVVTSDSIIAKNICELNDLAGILLRETSQHSTITSNVCKNNGNSPVTVPAYAKSGIAFLTSSFLTLLDNVCYDDRSGSQKQPYGIEANDTSSTNITLIGNQLSSNLIGDENVSTTASITPQYVSDVGIVNKAWTNATLLNSWVSYGAPYATAGYYKDSNGFVHLRGLIKSGTTSATTVILNLPAGYRPAFSVAISTFSNNGSTALPTGIDITASGSVQIGGSGAGNNYLALDGITFRAGI